MLRDETPFLRRNLVARTRSDVTRKWLLIMMIAAACRVVSKVQFVVA
jgi:hypothetical protein